MKDIGRDNDDSHGEHRDDIQEPCFDPDAQTRHETGMPLVYQGQADILVERRIGHYWISRLLGEGGMGQVYLARDDRLDRSVAVKLLRKEDSNYSQRLLREAKAMASLSHPNVVQVFEVGVDQDRPFVAMELVRGQTLQQWHDETPRPGWRACVRAYIQAGRGLAAAHKAGLVHRDFKPSNCMINSSQDVKVLDFGLARRATVAITDDTPDSEFVPTERASLVDPEGGSLTQTGMVLGTIAYMAPEAMVGLPTNELSDQFSFCTSLYEALYGERPFDLKVGPMSANFEMISLGQVRAAPPSPAIPRKLRQILLRGLRAEPEHRWPSMDVLLDRIERLIAPRVAQWFALGLAGTGLVVLGGGLSWYAEVGLRCRGAEQELSGVWDVHERKLVESAILAAETPYATDTWEFVSRELDGYAQQWREKHTEICEATRVTQTQTEEDMGLRMRCLDSCRRELRATVGVLAGPRGYPLEEVGAFVTRLPRLSRCDELDALGVALPPPDDEQVAMAVESLRDRLAESRANTELGRSSEWLDELEQHLEQAKALDYGPLVAETTFALGVASIDAGRYAEAEQLLEQAYLLALEHRHDQIELGSLSESIRLTGVIQSRFEEANRYSRRALALARRDGSELLDEVDILRNTALMLKEQGDLGASRANLERALFVQERLLGGSHLSIAHTLEIMGTVLREQGAYNEALVHLERAQAIYRRFLGDRHVNVGGVLVGMANVFLLQSRYQESLSYQRQALDIFEGALGERHPLIGMVMLNMGVALSEQWQLGEAMEHFNTAREILESTLGSEHINHAGVLTEIGSVLEQQGDHSGALEYHQRALSVFERVLGGSNHRTAKLVIKIGSTQAAQGNLTQALDTLQQALEIIEASLGPEHSDLIIVRSKMGAILRQQGQLDEAREHLERSVSIAERSFGREHQALTEPLTELARLALARGDDEAACSYAERGVAVGNLSGFANEPELADARVVLARCLWSEPTERARAHALAKQAYDAYVELGPGMHEALTEVDSWLEDHRVPRGSESD